MGNKIASLAARVRPHKNVGAGASDVEIAAFLSSVRPLDLLVFRGAEGVSKLIRALESRTNGNGDISHVEVCITRELCPRIRKIKSQPSDPGSNDFDDTLLSWGSTMSGPLSDGVKSAETGKSRFGVQVRVLEDLVRSYLSTPGANVGVCRLLDNPILQRTLEPLGAYRIRKAQLIENLCNAYDKYNNAIYEVNPLALLGAIFPQYRGINAVATRALQQFTQQNKWLFCSEFVALLYVEIGVIDDATNGTIDGKTLNPEYVVPVDFIGHEMDPDGITVTIVDSPIWIKPITIDDDDAISVIHELIAVEDIIVEVLEDAAEVVGVADAIVRGAVDTAGDVVGVLSGVRDALARGDANVSIPALIVDAVTDMAKDAVVGAVTDMAKNAVAGAVSSLTDNIDISAIAAAASDDTASSLSSHGRPPRQKTIARLITEESSAAPPAPSSTRVQSRNASKVLLTVPASRGASLAGTPRALAPASARVDNSNAGATPRLALNLARVADAESITFPATVATTISREATAVFRAATGRDHVPSPVIDVPRMNTAAVHVVTEPEDPMTAALRRLATDVHMEAEAPVEAPADTTVDDVTETSFADTSVMESSIMEASTASTPAKKHRRKLFGRRRRDKTQAAADAPADAPVLAADNASAAVNEVIPAVDTHEIAPAKQRKHRIHIPGRRRQPKVIEEFDE